MNLHGVVYVVEQLVQFGYFVQASGSDDRFEHGDELEKLFGLSGKCCYSRWIDGQNGLDDRSELLYLSCIGT